MYFKPMLADHVVLEQLKYPLMASTKLDGIRCINYHGRALSRSLKSIPNDYVQKMFWKYLRDFPLLDGELIVSEPTSDKCFRNTTSGIMSMEGEPQFYFYVFDVIPPEDNLDLIYTERMTDELTEKLKSIPFIKVVKQTLVYNLNDLFTLEGEFIEAGYEGLMIRHDLPYKFGRSSNREGILLKLKRYADSEAIIIGSEPLFENHNEAKLDELGKLTRSNKKDGMVRKELLGNLIVEDITTRVRFSIGSGFTQDERYQLWNKRLLLPGKILTYKYFPVGQKEAPRHPVFLGFRDRRDM